MGVKGLADTIRKAHARHFARNFSVFLWWKVYSVFVCVCVCVCVRFLFCFCFCCCCCCCCFVFNPRLTLRSYSTAMTTVACVRPKITLLSMIFVPFLLLIVYALMEKRSHSTTPSNDTTRPDVPYTPLNQDESANSPEQATLTWREKASVLRANGTLIFSFFVGYVAEFLSLHGVATTLAFPNAPFGPRNHYVYYATAFMLGESVGRCYLLVLGSCRTKTDLAIERTWVFSLVLSCILFFLCFAAWFRFLPSVWFVLVLMLVVGFLAGALYVNTYMVAGRDQDSLRKEFSRAMLPWSPAAGMVAAGFIGLVTEPALRRHCTEIASSVEYCFTRSMHGWNASTSCLITH